MNQIIMWIMAVGAVLGGVDRIAGNRFGLGKRFEEGFTLLGPTALSMSGIICLTPLLSRFLRFALVPIWNFLGLDAGLLAGILAIDMGGYQLAGELSASQEMVRYAGLVIAATLGCTITFTIPVGMGMLKSGDRLFFSRGMLIGTGTLPVTMIVGGLLSGLSFLQIVLQSLPVLLFCFLLMFGIWRFLPIKESGFLSTRCKSSAVGRLPSSTMPMYETTAIASSSGARSGSSEKPVI